MKKFKLKVAVAGCVVLLFLPWLDITVARSQDDTRARNLVTGQLGVLIKTDQGEFRAKANNQIPSETKVRLFIKVKEKAYLYAVHNDGKQVKKLFCDENNSFTLPSPQTYYDICPSKKKQAFSLIISSTAIAELQSSKALTIKTWDALEADLTGKSRIIANSNSIPFPLAGNLGADKDGTSKTPPASSILNALPKPSFIDTLPEFSGRGVIIKTYQFKTKGSR